MNNEATIEIRRDRTNNNLESVSVVMPVWDKENSDGSISITMPFFGIKFHAFNNMDIDKLAKDAIKGFCINCERFGLKLETELLALGWQELTKSTMVYKVDNFVFEQMVHTGEKHPQIIDFESSSINENQLELSH
ncbi:hypothetical protein GR160_02920 [Flavobacterium sp. Sd200]|uniref:hypothetical protein n=1 Tax=Flavobacterium sp. Sd200 TaxID=2692211 RepID=UPI0013712293|nr:hypothetical protein [Flavobacterium sp. Sd200]MXN90166.1 hypothetical protein [Flavobacterium sp. Sd200]